MLILGIARNNVLDCIGDMWVV